MNAPATKDAERVIELPAESFSRREDRELPALVPAANVTPLQLLNMAVSQGADLAKLEKLLDLQERWEKNEAKKAYDTAVAAFKANPPELVKTKFVSYANKTGGRTEYKHATLDQVALEIGSAMAPHGLSFRWSTEQKEGGMIRVTCTLSHQKGHSESVWLEAGRDDSGGKNNIQALGSTVTYLERYTLLAVTGLAAKEQDDDGKLNTKESEPEPDAEGKAALEACGSLTALQAAWKALTAEQRKTLGTTKDECKARIAEADKEAA